MENLVVRLRREIGIFQGEIFLGMNTLPKIRLAGGESGFIFLGAFHNRLYIYQGTNQVAKFFVEIG